LRSPDLSFECIRLSLEALIGTSEAVQFERPSAALHGGHHSVLKLRRPSNFEPNGFCPSKNPQLELRAEPYFRCSANNLLLLFFSPCGTAYTCRFWQIMNFTQLAKISD